MRRVTPTLGCWEWQPQSRDRHGYGRTWINGKVVLAHRAVYELALGPIPDGLTLDHLCSNPPCVNPWHLDPVSMLENILRGRNHGHETHCPLGHPYSGPNLLVLHRRGGRERRCRT